MSYELKKVIRNYNLIEEGQSDISFISSECCSDKCLHYWIDWTMNETNNEHLMKLCWSKVWKNVKLLTLKLKKTTKRLKNKKNVMIRMKKRNPLSYKELVFKIFWFWSLFWGKAILLPVFIIISRSRSVWSAVYYENNMKKRNRRTSLNTSELHLPKRSNLW